MSYSIDSSFHEREKDAARGTSCSFFPFFFSSPFSGSLITCEGLDHDPGFKE